jgi:hypothetical protein
MAYEFNAMSLKPEELYFELGKLIAEMPELATGPITPAINGWIARAVSLVESNGTLAEKVQLSVAADNLDGILRPRKAQTIAAVLHRALARAEAEAPASAQGAVIAAGETFDVFTAVGHVLTTAESDVLLVDPDADAKVLTDYAVLASHDVTVRLLADEADHKASLMSAADRWSQQFGDDRILMVRLAPANTLQDRLILVDSATAWVLGASFGNLAQRAHTSLVRMPAEAAADKIAAYATIWEEAKPLVPA